ncbi:dihydroxyacetone kinase subunit L [Halobacillus shinanisalinarum]|uniref:Dihydroxyacetone kinase subunit L n=1 Tax=Halobacillus shinanisalinarum TaxID=2932258 RepID=A0ABY4H2K1_9BACI|nr:dihydroxyacetone kinase subunit DhaL [Halobacillus shinanisalinarum]UOQ94534.1 dihydroxyacetone kinase subunit L [Halobacillus shinanisalinarum]
MELQVEQIVTWMEKANEKVQDNKEYLTSLDQAIGDGDHGINMARGFKEVVQKVSGSDYETASDILKDVAMTLMGKVGGAAGPLYGTAFLKLSASVKGKKSIDYGSFVTGLEEALAGMKQRGKSEQGEKTLIDTWAPVIEEMKKADGFDCDLLSATAKAAMEKTKDIKATKGRASYLGDRSIGHLDPGSVSSYYLFTSLAETIRGGK